MNQSAPSGAGVPAPAAAVTWWWQRLDPSGAVIEPEGGREEFPTRGDAESWLGETWADLLDGGVASVTLFEGEREVYGPMSLDAG